MVHGPESVGQGSGGVNPFANLEKVQARLAEAKKNNPELQNLLSGGALSFNPGMTGDTSKGGSIFPSKNFT